MELKVPNCVLTLMLVVILTKCVSVFAINANFSSRINNGQISGFLPHVVHVMAFRVPVGHEPAATYGGGSIISGRHVLTSARLIQGFPDIQIGYGSTNLLNLAVAIPNQVIFHPQYIPQTLQNDIAILALPFGTTWQPQFNVAPIRIADNTILPTIGLIGTVTGFGYTFPNEGFPSITLRFAQLTTAIDATCSANIWMTPSHFCAVSQPGFPSNVCEGDAGGGYFFWDGPTPVLVSILYFDIILGF